MRRLQILLLALCTVLFASGSLAEEPVRLALLIGNEGYTGKIQALKNPHNDIKTVGKALEGNGFKVTPLPDAGRRQMLSAVKSFAAELAKGGPQAVGFLYYSGHGVARPEDRANYLIPIDLKDTSSTDFWFDAVKLDDLLGELQRAAPFAAHFVVFDACRDELKLPYKSAVKGFEPVAERSGMFIAFATALGAVALDEAKAGTTASGPYASALAGELVKPGQDHLQLFQNVKEAVLAATSGAQQPWESNGLARRIYLTGEPLSVAEVVEQNFWSIVQDSDNPAVLQTYLDRYPVGRYAEVAHATIEQRRRELRVKQAILEAEQRRAEEERKATEAKHLEEVQRMAALELAEARRSEAARRAKEKELSDQLKQVSEEAQTAKIAAREAEERSKVAARDAEDARATVDAARKAQVAVVIAEEQRNAALKEAAESRRALEAAQANQVASLAATGDDKVRSDAADAEMVQHALEALEVAQKAAEAAETQKQVALKEAEDARVALQKLKATQEAAGASQVAALPLTRDGQAGSAASSQLSKYAELSAEGLAKEMQKELERVGCNPGDVNGKWDEKGNAALGRFIKYAKVSLKPDMPTPEALDTIAAQRVRICPLECQEGQYAVGEKCVPKPKEPRRQPAVGGNTSSNGYQTCGRNGCQWVPAGCTAIPHGGGGGLGGRIHCPGR